MCCKTFKHSFYSHSTLLFADVEEFFRSKLYTFFVSRIKKYYESHTSVDFSFSYIIHFTWNKISLPCNLLTILHSLRPQNNFKSIDNQLVNCHFIRSTSNWKISNFSLLTLYFQIHIFKWVLFNFKYFSYDKINNSLNIYKSHCKAHVRDWVKQNIKSSTHKLLLLLLLHFTSFLTFNDTFPFCKRRNFSVSRKK
jgi:hypothetical protein